MTEIIEVASANPKLEESIIPKGVSRRRDFRIRSLLLASILSGSFDRAFNEYVKFIGDSNHNSESN